MPTPSKNETQDEFVKRCIPMLIDEGKDTEQAYAMCSTMYNLPMKEVKLGDLCGVNKISLVDEPAIEYNFVAMNKQKIIQAKIESDKKILTGPVLIPDQLILRKNEKTGEMYNQFFTKETIQEIVEKYFLEQKNVNVNVDHSIDVNDVFVYESWIIEDPKNDKSSSLGFDLPQGTWMISMKCNNDKVWNELIKTQATKGFSIEGIFDIKMSIEPSNDDLLLGQIIDILENIDPKTT